MDKDADRRKHARVKSLNLVSVASSGSKQTSLVVGRTLDLSNGGMKLELKATLPLRSMVILTLALGDEIIEVMGRVCYLHELDEETCALGIQFVNLAEGHEELIEEYLASRS